MPPIPHGEWEFTFGSEDDARALRRALGEAFPEFKTCVIAKEISRVEFTMVLRNIPGLTFAERLFFVRYGGEEFQVSRETFFDAMKTYKHNLREQLTKREGECSTDS